MKLKKKKKNPQGVETTAWLIFQGEQMPMGEGGGRVGSHHTYPKALVLALLGGLSKHVAPSKKLEEERETEKWVRSACRGLMMPIHGEPQSPGSKALVYTIHCNFEFKTSPLFGK